MDIERSVAEAFVRGEREALGAVFEAVGPLARNYLWMLTGNAELADDLAQDVFAMAFRDCAKLRDPDRLVAWIMRIARSVGHSELRKMRRRPTVSLDAPASDETEDNMWANTLASDAPESDPAEMLAGAQAGDLLRAAVSELRDKERDMVLMIYMLDMKQREVAEALDIPLSSVGTTLRRALAKLRDHLESQGLKAEDLL